MNRLFHYLLLLLLIVGCRQTDDAHDDHDHNHGNAGGTLALPELAEIELDGRKLNVVATTSIIGDVVANVGGDMLELSVLIGRNQDSHSYELTPQDFVALENADVIFVNGWDLEEQLAEIVEENFAAKGVAISAEITPRTFDSQAADPHVWFSIHNAEQWAENAATVLTQLDPTNGATYAANLETYLAQLTELEEEIEELLTELPTDKRKLVTNHDAFGYFADEYGFEVVGTVIPSFSSSAEPSASDLAELANLMEAEEVCTVFAETSRSDDLARTVSAELTHCDSVQVLQLYTGSIGDGAADSYIGLYRENVKTIVEGLR